MASDTSYNSETVAAICHKWGVQAWATSLPPSILLVSFPLVDSPGGLGRIRSPAAKHFDAIYAAKQLYKIHIDV